METDFPVTPVDRLHIFAEQACSAAVLMDMIGAGGPAREESDDGSRWGIEDAGNSGRRGFRMHGASGERSGAPYGEQTSVAAGSGAMSDFTESEGENADVIEQGGAQGNMEDEQNAVIDERAENGDAG